MLISISDPILNFELNLNYYLMTIKESQQLVDQWIKAKGVRYFSELTNMAILTEEVGEVARLMSRLYGDQSFKDKEKDKELADELADVLWVLICIANQTGVNLTEALQKNFEKKDLRDSERHLGNEKYRKIIRSAAERVREDRPGRQWLRTRWP